MLKTHLNQCACMYFYYFKKTACDFHPHVPRVPPLNNKDQKRAVRK